MGEWRGGDKMNKERRYRRRGNRRSRYELDCTIDLRMKSKSFFWFRCKNQTSPWAVLPLQLASPWYVTQNDMCLDDMSHAYRHQVDHFTVKIRYFIYFMVKSNILFFFHPLLHERKENLGLHQHSNIVFPFCSTEAGACSHYLQTSQKTQSDQWGKKK